MFFQELLDGHKLMETQIILSKKEADIVGKVLLSNKVNYWTGIKNKEFEDSFAKYCGTKYAIALSNGTVALEIALKSINISKGDEVIVTPRSFIASVSCVVSMGAKPVFADVDLNTGNITHETIKKNLSNKTKAIICVHLGGYPCDMDPIMRLAKKEKLFVVEDCSQAHGAFYKNKSVGSMGDIGTWSFCQDKIITTAGEGGMITTNNKKLWSKMWSLKDHGKNYDSIKKNILKNQVGFNWVHDSFGSNYRMTEIQASIGIYQLTKLDKWNYLRKRNSLMIYNVLKNFKDIVRIPQTSNQINHAWYKCYIYIKPKYNRNNILTDLKTYGLPCMPGSCSEIYNERAFDKIITKPKKSLKNAKDLGDTSIAFSVHPSLKKKEIIDICLKLKRVFGKIQNH